MERKNDSFSHENARNKILNEEEFEVIELFDQKALFANERIEDDLIPKGFFKYELRADDNGDFATIEKRVVINHCGTIITKAAFNFENGEYYEFTKDTSPNFLGEEMTFKDFSETK